MIHEKYFAPDREEAEKKMEKSWIPLMINIPKQPNAE